MQREQLAHVLSAVCDVAGDADVVVLGSQAILGSFDEDDLPPVATMSMEADVAWLSDSSKRERAELVNGAIGEMSAFHDQFGYYPEGVSLETAVLPESARAAPHVGAGFVSAGTCRTTSIPACASGSTAGWSTGRNVAPELLIAIGYDFPY
jgi:hypothetical protein